MHSTTKNSYLNIGSFILGFGLIGALDGVIYHQLLQWHSVYMETSRPEQIVSDGLFHFLVTIALFIGGILLWKAGNPSNYSMGVRLLIGGILIGGGTFNLLEGVINHHILKIHRVKPGDPFALAYDLGFLLLGLIFILVGLYLRNRVKRKTSIFESH